MGLGNVSEMKYFVLSGT